MNIAKGGHTYTGFILVASTWLARFLRVHLLDRRVHLEIIWSRKAPVLAAIMLKSWVRSTP